MNFINPARRVGLLSGIFFRLASTRCTSCGTETDAAGFLSAVATLPGDKAVGRAGLAGMVIEMEREARLAVAYAAVVVDTCVTPALRPACRQLLAAPNDDGPTLAAKLGAIDFAIKGRPCISDRP